MKPSDRLKIYRTTLGLSQEAMGNHLGAIPQTTYSKYETGSAGIPIDVLERLSQMGLNLNWLIRGEDPMMGPQISIMEVHEKNVAEIKRVIAEGGVVEEYRPGSYREKVDVSIRQIHIQLAVKYFFETIKELKFSIDPQPTEVLDVFASDIAMIAEKLALGSDNEETRTGIKNRVKVLIRFVKSVGEFKNKST